jgi:hypothetical protein
MKRREGIEFWERHLEGWRASGLTQEAYCREQGLSFTTFARWRNRINRQRKVARAAPARLIPVTVKTAPVPQTSTPNTITQNNSGHIEIRLGNGRAIALGVAFDEDDLARVVRLLEALPC